jgi:hypothetical protein
MAFPPNLGSAALAEQARGSIASHMDALGGRRGPWAPVNLRLTPGPRRQLSAVPAFGVPAIGGTAAELKAHFGSLPYVHNQYYDSTRAATNGGGKAIYQRLAYAMSKSGKVVARSDHKLNAFAWSPADETRTRGQWIKKS